MSVDICDKSVVELIHKTSQTVGVPIGGGRIRRTSSRFCLGVEHGDYNGTELFGVGTDRFIWLAYRTNDKGRVRLFSQNFPGDGVVDFDLADIPAPQSSSIAHNWARFVYGVLYVLRREGYKITKGIDGIVYGNIPGGGMSRSASLTLNLILSIFDANGIAANDQMRIVDLAQMVENDYIGSPCGKLDQIMILFAKEGLGTHYNPAARSVSYIPLGGGAADFRLVSLDTGTVRPGLEKSTYRIRRAECEELVSLLQKAGYKISNLADIKDSATYEKIITQFQSSHFALCRRLTYIYHARQRFYEMLDAWKRGDIETVGRVFRADGIGLRDEYQISGPELETMCDIARTVPGVLGERMLGGGDKGAAGAIVLAGEVDALKQAVDTAYPISHPLYKDKYAVHACKVVDGVRVYNGI
ncbi:MAG: galactokinase [Sedimentisphaerales bacterium]